MHKRIVSLWFPRLASDRVLRSRPVAGPFALTIRQDSTEWLHCLNGAAEAAGLSRGMGYADARALCPDLVTRPADPMADQAFRLVLARWAGRYSPFIGLEGADGLVLDVTGASHLFGGEEAMLDDMRARLSRAGLGARAGLADTRGAAWALARFGEGIAPSGRIGQSIGALPVAALRLAGPTIAALNRLGLRSIADLRALPRATLARRFGTELVLRLDQAFGDQGEPVSPLPEPAHYGVRMTLPEPIGLADDVMAGLDRLLRPLCARLNARQQGARILCLTLQRVDQASHRIELRLARPMRDPARILPLFQRSIDEVDAGFGIDRLRLEATAVEHWPAEQIVHTEAHGDSAHRDGLDDLITRLGSRIGLDNILRFLPADSHIPECGFLVAAAAYSAPAGSWPLSRRRPVRLFAPEPITPDPVTTEDRDPPRSFRWRRMRFATARATGPERIAPEWWLQDENWRSGLRDYWRVETREGRRLWLFHTPQAPGWFVQGEFA